MELVARINRDLGFCAVGCIDCNWHFLFPERISFSIKINI